MIFQTYQTVTRSITVITSFEKYIFLLVLPTSEDLKKKSQKHRASGAQSYLIASNAMLLLKLLPIFQPPHCGRWIPPSWTAEFHSVGGRDSMQPLLHLFCVGPVRCS